MNGIDLQTQGHKSTAEALAEAHALNVTTSTSHPNPALSEAELASLQDMSREGLISLIERIAGARWGEIATLKPAQVAEAMKLRLAHIALTADVKEALTAIDKWLDRHEGKALVRTDAPQAGANVNIYGVAPDVIDGWMRDYFEKQAQQVIEHKPVDSI